MKGMRMQRDAICVGLSVAVVAATMSLAHLRRPPAESMKGALDVNGIRLGMSRAQVKALVGSPKKSERGKKVLLWTFESSNRAEGIHRVAFASKSGDESGYRVIDAQGSRLCRYGHEILRRGDPLRKAAAVLGGPLNQERDVWVNRETQNGCTLYVFLSDWPRTGRPTGHDPIIYFSLFEYNFDRYQLSLTL